MLHKNNFFLDKTTFSIHWKIFLLAKLFHSSYFNNFFALAQPRLEPMVSSICLLLLYFAKITWTSLNHEGKKFSYE